MSIMLRLASLVNVGLRGSSLVFRFALSFYIIKYLGLTAAGIYGLALGAIGLAPAMTTFGMNYFLARDLVGMPPGQAAPRIKTRLVASTVATAVLTAVAGAVAYAISYPVTPIIVIIAVLVWLENYANDLYVSLIALEMPLLANVAMFIRLAAWIPFVIGLGLLLPQTRSIEYVLFGWLVSYGFYFAVLLYALRRWPLAEALRAPIQTGWIKERLRQGWLIYFSDIGIVGYTYADRYIVSLMLGLELTGLYNFYWSLANALQTLLFTAIIQVALPVLFKAFNTGNMAEWRAAMRRQMKKTASYAVVLGICVYGGSELLIALMGMSHLTEHRGVFIMLVLAAVIRSGTDLANVGITSVRLDRIYALTNLSSLAISCVVTSLCVWWLGFVGVGVASLGTASVVTAIKAWILVRFAWSDVRASKAALPADQP
ncbi:lipopolysaccharide biosynthesis protein [Xanthobacter autotrophicus]|uniref:lipopolysaccharide biosynthesis protein n=1 Tax=Xanthobacter autotrophicus TaxID=280 RepID=UPI00372A694C